MIVGVVASMARGSQLTSTCHELASCKMQGEAAYCRPT